MADTVITCTVSPCTVVLQLSHPVLDMTPDEAALIGFATVALWAVAVVFRQLSRLIKDDGFSTSQGE